MAKDILNGFSISVICILMIPALVAMYFFSTLMDALFDETPEEKKADYYNRDLF